MKVSYLILPEINEVVIPNVFHIVYDPGIAWVDAFLSGNVFDIHRQGVW